MTNHSNVMLRRLQASKFCLRVQILAFLCPSAEISNISTKNSHPKVIGKFYYKTVTMVTID